MTQHQISVSRKELHHMSWGENKEVYAFFFRTDWMETSEAFIALEKIKEKFLFPEFKIHINERETTLRQIDIT